MRINKRNCLECMLAEATRSRGTQELPDVSPCDLDSATALKPPPPNILPALSELMGRSAVAASCPGQTRLPPIGADTFPNQADCPNAPYTTQASNRIHIATKGGAPSKRRELANPRLQSAMCAQIGWRPAALWIPAWNEWALARDACLERMTAPMPSHTACTAQAQSREAWP